MASSEQLEREAERCRAQLSGTLEELRSSLTPGRVVDQVTDYVRETSGGMFTENLKQQVVANPLPLALMGASVAWLMWGSRNASAARDGASRANAEAARARDDASAAIVAAHDSARGYADRAGEAASDAMDRATDVGTRAADQVRDLSAGAGETMRDAAARVAAGAREGQSRLADTASALSDEAAKQTSRVAGAMAGSAAATGHQIASQTRSFVQLCRDEPLVLASLGIAVGALAGALLPSTRVENQLMGDASDTVKTQAKDLAEQGVQQASAAGERLYDEAQGADGQGGSAGQERAAGSPNAAGLEDEDVSLAPAMPAEPERAPTG